jgi:hypothetical protein
VACCELHPLVNSRLEHLVLVVDLIAVACISAQGIRAAAHQSSSPTPGGDQSLVPATTLQSARTAQLILHSSVH